MNIRRRASGYTLIELLVSSSIASVLLVGMGSSIYIASQAFEADEAAPAEIAQADETLAQVLRDAQQATSVSELTATSATFTVPDRNGDGAEETIRYAWSGTPGEPLTYQYNGGPVQNIAEDVQHFEMTYLSRFMEGSTVTGELLFVSGAGGTDPPSTEEQQRIDLIETWGYTVTIVRHTASDGEFNTAIANSHVVFISGEASWALVGPKLNNLTIGIVNEQYDLAVSLGFCADTRTRGDDTINIVDNSHYITSTFSNGAIVVLNNDQILMAVDDGEGYAADMQTLARFDGGGDRPSLVLLDEGDTDYNGRTVNNRRVMLPWGAVAFDFSQLNADGQTIMQRSIEWAAEPAMSQAQQAQSGGSEESLWGGSGGDTSLESGGGSWFDSWLN